MVKTRKKNSPSQEDVEKVTNELADRTYGETKDKVVGTSITLPQSLLYKAEDFALKNKRKENSEPKNVSAIIKEALVDYLAKKDII